MLTSITLPYAILVPVTLAIEYVYKVKNSLRAVAFMCSSPNYNIDYLSIHTLGSINNNGK